MISTVEYAMQRIFVRGENRSMKKALVGIVLLVLLLCGCTGKEITAAEDEIAVVVDISGVTDDVYRADIEYFLDEEWMGGMAMGHADGTVYKEPDTVFRFTSECFPENADLSNFSFHIVLSYDKDGIEGLFSESARISPSNPCEPFAAEYGNIYRYSVTGSYTDGLVLGRE